MRSTWPQLYVLCSASPPRKLPDKALSRVSCSSRIEYAPRMKLAIALGKVVVLATWLWGLASFVSPGSVPVPDIGRMVFLGLLAVHAGEAFAFAKTLLAEAGGSLGGHVWQLLVFGYLHVMGVRYG